VQDKQRANERANEIASKVLAAQARDRVERGAESFGTPDKVVAETSTDRRLDALQEGPHQDENVPQWQKDLTEEREKERRRDQREEIKRAQHAADWESFKQNEQLEIELRKDGQLAKLLGEPLPEESLVTLERLAQADQSQAEAGLVALMSGGKTSYKSLEDLSQEDVPARVAANRLRTSWLKERSEVWGGYGE
jgi:hypothetical protein